jgi:hypothetical protein
MNCCAPRVADSFASRLAEWRGERGWKDGVAGELLAHFARINAIGTEAPDQSANFQDLSVSGQSFPLPNKGQRDNNCLKMI